MIFGFYDDNYYWFCLEKSICCNDGWISDQVFSTETGYCLTPKWIEGDFTHTAVAPSKVGGFSTFLVATHVSANRVGASQLQLANKIAHRGRSNSKHVGYFCSIQAEIWFLVSWGNIRNNATRQCESSMVVMYMMMTQKSRDGICFAILHWVDTK